MTQHEIVFSGFGGQGVMFIGQLLSYAALDAGKEVTWIPSYGPEMRGGTAHCFVVISDKPIGSPIVRHPKVAVVFNLPSFDKYESQIAENGLLVVNSSLVKRSVQRTEIRSLEIPATEIAEEIGNNRLTNVVLLGALLQSYPVLSLDVLYHALEHHIPAHRRNLLEMNLEAARRGAEVVEKLVVQL
jgi:2-oxoglutarate ferredoxin oxidoreductase subunit gamma